ncbi:calcium release-activated calcium channel protein 1 isoform X1 [Chironomus tepperi]|uniref:calcium release-activated calcium channel protein 1 isoform X1 n=1 Tax=Chironomus tepperi TaxID=113505 RepID=UPI00391FBF9C
MQQKFHKHSRHFIIVDRKIKIRVLGDMSERGKKIFAAAGISTSLDTVLATTLGTTYHSRLKKSNPNLLSEKSLSNNSSKSSSGSSLTLTNNNNINSNNNNINSEKNQYPHHQFYCSQISTSANWHSNRNSISSQKRRSGLSTGLAMSQTDEFHTPNYLSWRKLQLSRAKLKASSKTSALLSGFAMVAMVEVQLNNDTKVPLGMLIAFSVCTTLLVAVHMLALMISTCILPNIETVCNLHSISLVHESPHERLHWYIEIAWAFSTLIGLVLFLIEIAILCWVKFYDLSQAAAWSACIVLVPVLVVFLAFAIHFYRSLMSHKYEVSVSGIRELEMLREQIEQDNIVDQHRRRNPNGLNYSAAGTEVV